MSYRTDSLHSAQLQRLDNQCCNLDIQLSWLYFCVAGRICSGPFLGKEVYHYHLRYHLLSLAATALLFGITLGKLLVPFLLKKLTILDYM
jgi:hypothetical protein